MRKIRVGAWRDDRTGPMQVVSGPIGHERIHLEAPAAARLDREMQVADLALARSEHSPQRFYSMSAQIRQERAEYYDILERTQKGTLDVTPWMAWFLACLGRAIDGAQTTLAAVLAEARFWQAFGAEPISERQRLMLNRLLGGFEGKLTTSKWATIAKCSSDTALRDILDLVERGRLVRSPEGGRSTSYALVEVR
jgi:Fic family protein